MSDPAYFNKVTSAASGPINTISGQWGNWRTNLSMAQVLGAHIGKLETLLLASEGDEVVHPDNVIPLDIRPEEWLNPRLLPDLQAEQTRLVAQYRESHAEEIQMREEGRLADECNNHGEMCRSLAESFRSQREQMNQSLPRPSPSQRGGSSASGSNAASGQTLNSLLKAMVSGDGLIDATAQQAIRQQQQQHLQLQYQQLQQAAAKAAAANQASAAASQASSAQSSGSAQAAAQATLQSQLQQHQQQERQKQQQQVVAAHQALHIQAQAQHVQQQTQVDPHHTGVPGQRAAGGALPPQQRPGALPPGAMSQQQAQAMQQQHHMQQQNQAATAAYQEKLTAQQAAALKARGQPMPSSAQGPVSAAPMPGAKSTSSMAAMAAKMGGAAKLQAQMQQQGQLHSVTAPQPGTHPYAAYTQQQAAAAAAAAAASASGQAQQQQIQPEYVPQQVRRQVDFGPVPNVSNAGGAGRPQYHPSSAYAQQQHNAQQHTTATQPMHPQPLVQFSPPPHAGNVYRGPPGNQPQAKR